MNGGVCWGDQIIDATMPDAPRDPMVIELHSIMSRINHLNWQWNESDWNRPEPKPRERVIEYT